MIRIILFVTILLSFDSYAIEDKSVPTKILSKSLKVNYGENTATYLGDVRVAQNNLLINCDAMKIYYHNSGNDDLLVNSGSIDKIEFERNVSIVRDGTVAKGDEGIFEPDKERILLTGNAHIQDKENHLKSEAVVYDTVKKVFSTINMNGSSKKRVRILISED